MNVTTGATTTVVVATRDRPALLDRCLAAIGAQTRPADAVVVVDDASVGDATREVVERHAATLPLRVVRMASPGGPGRARQRGWRAAATELVAFTDDDCRPSPGWLEAFAAQTGPRRVLVGRTLPDPEDGPLRSVFDRSMRIESHDGRFSTCNVVYPRGVLEEVGGFDDAFDIYGEDTDLGQRARRAGAEDRWVPDALVWHAVHRGTARSAVRDRRRVGEIARLVRRHPQLRTEIWEGTFWKPQHRRLLGVAAALAGAPLSPVALLAALAWIDEAPGRVRYHTGRWEDRPRRERLAQVAGLAAIDATEVASCALGSLRHRTLFL